MRAQASIAFPAWALHLCRKRHHALRLGGLIPAYKSLAVGSKAVLRRKTFLAVMPPMTFLFILKYLTISGFCNDTIY